ncbi:hypothetical protein BGZ51_004971 [Haplosporangium sp. Z 767]|nr:hypothetical protein BGZ50_005631 [Haplosporangium sp. Z 11]KAF9182097.1 hypothetical protein BGZ51_004971 [Haplosporangium sp. Z 767]
MKSSCAWVVTLAILFYTSTPLIVQAAPDPIMEICSVSGCDTVSSILAPCGGGADGSSLQNDLDYTVTPELGSCQCNSEFFNAFSNCLACISSQGKNSPRIDNQQNWVASCESYGYNFTSAPIPYKPPVNGGSSSLSKGGIIGIVIAALVVVALAGTFVFLRTRKRRTKAGIFERPYTSASSGAGGSYAPTPTEPTFNAYSNYHNTDYPDNNAGGGGYTDQDQQYYNYDQNVPQQQLHYGSDQNGGNSDMVMMNNLQNPGYIPPPAPMSAAAVAAVADVASPRPSDSFPQSLRKKPTDWDNQQHQHEYPSDFVSSHQLLRNEKAEFDDGEELEPPRTRDRFANDRSDFTARRSLTPPRANMQSYRDEFARPSFEREPRRNSGSERGSVSGINLVRGGAGYDSNDEEGLKKGTAGDQETPESARRRRAAELFSAEGHR